MADITFLSQGITFKLTGTKKTSDWLLRISLAEKRKIETLTYVFCTDGFLSKLHAQYLGQDSLTDILTFDYSRSGPIEAEIYISIARVKENAKNFKQPFSKELRRVIVHGLLHILGYNDKTKAQCTSMRRKEEACLSLWN